MLMDTNGNTKELLIKDLCSRLPYGVKIQSTDENIITLTGIILPNHYTTINGVYSFCDCCPMKPYLFPMSSMTDEDHAIYSKIWEDTGKTAYLEGCHHLISTIKAYKAANDFLLSKHYDINGLIPKDLANDATGLNIY